METAKPGRAVLIAAIVLAAVPVAGPAWAAGVTPKLVYKIDSVIATLARGRLSIQVKGAVPSGGWTAARLKLMRSPANTIVVDFLALPPRAGVPVIQGLLPVSAALAVPMRKGVVMVRAVSDANEMTSQILK